MEIETSDEAGSGRKRAPGKPEWKGWKGMLQGVYVHGGYTYDVQRV